MLSSSLETARGAYRIDGSDDGWLETMLAPLAREIGAGLGGWIATYDTREPPLKLLAMVSDGMFEGWRAAIRLGVGMVPEKYTRRAFDVGVCGTLSQLLGERLASTPAARHLLPSGVHDLLGLNARDPGGLGVVVAVHLPRVTALAPAVVERWERVAAHIAAGHRLRGALAGGSLTDGAEAILEADGRVAHAAEPAQTPAAQETLRRAARALKRAATPRASRPAGPDHLLGLWQALVDGRWTLVDHFDSDGRRYFVARKNDPAAPAHAALTGRQRQIVGWAALGHSNKLIAYELGLSQAAVSNHLGRASRRLGALNRIDLVRRFLASAGPPTAVESVAEGDG